MSKNTVKNGKYVHFKSNNYYEVIGVAHHSETKEEMVIYKALYYSDEYGSDSVWVRPKKIFCENVAHNGLLVPRFKYIENQT